jgi:hypothetical protein
MTNLLQKFSLALVLGLGLLGLPGPAQAQNSDQLCTRICAAIIQSMGDDVKEQISLDCIQQTGQCTGEGYFQTEQERIPVTIEGTLMGDTLDLRVHGNGTTYAPDGKDALVATLTPGTPVQATQFVVYNHVDGTPFARSGTPFAITVMTQRLSEQSSSSQ